MSYIGLSKIPTIIFSLVSLADGGVIKFLIDWDMFYCNRVIRSCRKLDLPPFPSITLETLYAYCINKGNRATIEVEERQQGHDRGGRKATGLQ